MEENVVDIETSVLNRFQKNMEMLQTHYPHIFQKIHLLDEMISDGTFSENFSLEYITEQNEFDIIYLKENSSFYGKNPKTYNQNVLNTLAFDKQNTINALPEHIYIQDNVEVKFDNFSTFEQNSYNQMRNDIYPFTKLFTTDVYNKENHLKNFNKFIFFGTLLGTHIVNVFNKFKPKVTLIIEPNLEMFRLSLFITDYVALAKSTKLIFSVMEDDNSFTKTIDTFIGQLVFNNDAIKFYTTNINTESYIQKTIARVSRLNPTSYPYTNQFIFFERAINYKKDNYNFLDLNNICNKKQEMPILLLAAGPSLNEHLDWLQKNQNRFILSSPLSVIELLLQNDIFVDIAIIGDFSSIQQDHFTKETKEYLKTITILSNASIDPIVIQDMPKGNIFFIEATTSFLRQQIIGCSTVGDMSLYLLLKLHFNKIYILGLDLAYSEDDKGYIENYHKGKEKIFTDTDHVAYTKSENESLEKNYGIHKNTLKIKGNFRVEVASQIIWYYSLQACNSFTQNHKQQETLIYNLSDGAFIDNTTPLKIDNLDTSKLKILDKKSLNTIFMENSYKNLQKDELKILNKEIEFVSFCIEILNKKFKKNFKSYEKYLEKKNQYYQSSILSQEKNFTAFTNIFYNLTYLIETYVNAQLNIKNDTQINPKELHKIWKTTLQQYLERYLKRLLEIKEKHG